MDSPLFFEDGQVRRMNGYVDIHSHVLYGVDDGSRSIEMSMDMIEKAYNEGIRVQYATPHFSLDKRRSAGADKIKEHFAILKKKVEEKYPDYKLLLGSELYYEPGMVDALKDGRALTMNGSRIVLVEFAFGGHFRDMQEGIKKLTAARYKPIIAHVERYSCLKGNFDRLDELRELGVMFQLNTENLYDGRLSSNYRNAIKLIKNEYIDYVATDAHNLKSRPPLMKDAMDVIYKKFGENRLKKELEA